ncbi:MAG: hypothetical protein COU65_04720 [Candidatus Pacebacteria bacterium CG10_big_fil_rev_8_21_14_0_10_42_12]|nr:MAG: hypothetical protein COU65_04720 [Candidatus Pacebacteria bacterium CG10_big_fil_rev_8_21_14_0_10_42_12]
MTNNESQKINISEGTISFWIHPNKVNFSNNEVVPITQLSPSDGSIFILKDSDNKMKFFHVYLGKGRTDVEYDVSKLDKTKKHMFTFTWSVKNKELKLYIDGESKNTVKINY